MLLTTEGAYINLEGVLLLHYVFIVILALILSRWMPLPWTSATIAILVAGLASFAWRHASDHFDAVWELCVSFPVVCGELLSPQYDGTLWFLFVLFWIVPIPLARSALWVFRPQYSRRRFLVIALCALAVLIAILSAQLVTGAYLRYWAQ